MTFEGYSKTGKDSHSVAQPTEYDTIHTAKVGGGCDGIVRHEPEAPGFR